MFEQICAVLRECARNGSIPAYIEELSITPNMSLADVGLDSLGRLTVFSELCMALKLPQLDFDLQDDVSLATLAQFILHNQMNDDAQKSFDTSNATINMMTKANGASYG